MASKTIEIHLIADSTGDTAARVARAASAQFPDCTPRIIKHSMVVTKSGLDAVFEQIPAVLDAPTAVFSTVVDEELRRALTAKCLALEIAHFDLLGPAVAVIENVTGDRAERVPARPVGVAADYFERIDAMEFAIKHDDGQHPEGLKDADIVIVGVSRTGKTPLSMYLGYLGYRTANVPLIAGIKPPAELAEVDRGRLVALTIDPQRLAAIRTRRVRSLASGQGLGAYADLPAIFDEIADALRFQRALRCPVIDTTTLALEEAARRIIDVIGARRPG